MLLSSCYATGQTTRGADADQRADPTDQRASVAALGGRALARWLALFGLAFLHLAAPGARLPVAVLD
jgi:hypothetical protein